MTPGEVQDLAAKQQEHTEACYAQPHCTVCGKRKAPNGRSVPMEMATSLCNADCNGYHQEPLPGHLWPDERPRLRDEGSVREDAAWEPLER
jgi:hypothetical protein